MYNFFKRMLISIGIIIALIVIVGTLFINLSPQFGGKASPRQEEEYAKSANYKERKFINLGNINMSMSAKDMLKAIVGMIKAPSNTSPNEPIAVQQIDSTEIANYASDTRFVWFGHSAFLLQIAGKNILIDPMLSEVPAPHPWLGGKRFSRKLPISLEKTPQIDAIIISHDHYDHLDYTSIIALKDKTTHFYVPLGLSSHLISWGVKEEQITELDWWQKVNIETLTFTCTPAQHFSGRGLTDRDKTLWCSWVIQSPTENIFFSGDSGYGSHFKEIGKRFGSFDFAMIECGQYNELWSEIHMFPEETAQVALDLNAKLIMPIHWGAFKLAQHAWTDPIERVIKKAKELNVALISPRIGEETVLSDNHITQQSWWKNN